MKMSVSGPACNLQLSLLHEPDDEYLVRAIVHESKMFPREVVWYRIYNVGDDFFLCFEKSKEDGYRPVIAILESEKFRYIKRNLNPDRFEEKALRSVRNRSLANG